MFDSVSFMTNKHLALDEDLKLLFDTTRNS
ncbi:hypothetical protein BXY75_2393 [Ulvibacter antarcticus]|uniref:Uncharacterized protein n=1 Tax=Ulvibacter antarcticus TaxID=442714 RepID=A0A3L9YEC1_9FLAO|nr:hypothetical protein BXY75_2393 [Ulvibacter antarcticus]